MSGPKRISAGKSTNANGNTKGRVSGEPGAANVPASQANPPAKAETPAESSTGTKVLDGLQVGLDVVGLIPGVGEVADLANAGISALRGDWIGAGLSLASAIPFAGWGATAAKAAKRGTDLAKGSAEAAAKAAKEKVEREAKEKAAKEAEAAAAKKKADEGGKAKPKGKKPDCGKRGAYNKQDGDFAGHEMERDHVPSGAALKEAILEKAKKSGSKFTPAQLKSLENKVVQHAQTIAVPNEVHAAGETYKSKNKPLYKNDSKDLAGAAKRDNATHRKNIDNDKHKGCKGALNKAADEIDAITNDQYDKYFDKLINDVKKGNNTIDPWKGILK